MIELVFALLLIQDHKIIEHRYHESLSQCMKAKRYAMKDKSSQDRVVYKCIKSVSYTHLTLPTTPYV